MADTDPGVIAQNTEEKPNMPGPRRKHVPAFRFPPLIGWGEIIRRIRKFNFYRILREKAVRWYLKRMTACPERGLLVCWQPLYFIFIKTALTAAVCLLLFSGYPYLSTWLKEGLAFFRLNEIYNFTFPEQGFFDNLAKGILLAVIGYYGLFFVYHQFQALCSSFAVSTPNRKAYYIRSFFIKKDLHVIAVPSLDYFSINHNLVFRLLGVGTLVLKNRSGEKMKIRYITHAAQAVKKMSLLKQKKKNGARSIKRDPWDEM